ncbi:MAG: glycosyltransferase family A protein [Rhodospirillales bacterium]
MPAFNAAESIGRALASLAAQTRPPAEIIVVDDGSTDATAAVVQAESEKLLPSRLVLVTQPNRGAGAARNRAVGMATQPLLGFLDADDRWLERKIELCLPAFDDPAVRLVCTDFDLVTPDGRTQRLRSSRRLGNPARCLRDQFLYGSVGTSTVLARSDAVLRAGGFDDRLPAAQDYDLWIEILGEPDARLVVLEEPLTVYTGGHSGITGNVAKRRDCSMLSLYQQAWRLRGAGEMVALADVMKRTLIVHLQAVAAHREKTEIMAVPGDIMLMLCRLPLAVLRLYLPKQRRRVLTGEPDHG